MVLRLRISPEVWSAATEVDPNFDQTIQKHLNGVCWLFSEERPVYDGLTGACRFTGVYQMVATANFQFYLEKPKVLHAGWDYDIVFFSRIKKFDRCVAIAGREVQDEIVVLAPGQGILAQSAVLAEVGFIVKTHEYRQLASHLKAPINLAWGKIRKGRTTQRVFYGDDVLFLLKNKDSTQAGPASDNDLMDEALRDVGVGRVITDPYELRKLREMIDKFGETMSGKVGEGTTS